VYGLVPHTFCIAFILLSVIGATAASSMVVQFLYLPYFLEIIIALSIAFATFSAAFYLKRQGLLSLAGLKRKRRYLAVLYGTTLAVNLLFFWVVFPAVANMELGPSPAAPQSAAVQPSGPGTVTLRVDIPCPGHAPLIISELERLAGVTGVRYRRWDLFDVSYDPERLTVQEILELRVFQSFRARVQS
jgi:hypothetical protein